MSGVFEAALFVGKTEIAFGEIELAFGLGVLEDAGLGELFFA